MKALQKALDLGFTEEEVREEILPVLGMEPSPFLLEEYRLVGSLVPGIHDLIHEKKLPFRGASALNRFQKEEQVFLARSIFQNVHLTTNQLSLFAEWLFDLKRSRKISLEVLGDDDVIQAILKNPHFDLRAKGEKLFEKVRALRFPRLLEEEKEFLSAKRQWENSNREIRVERPEGFESEGMVLRAHLKNRESLWRVFDFLEANRASLESFLGRKAWDDDSRG